MIAFLLWFLATLDGALTGYREAAGRSALIDKRRYFRRAMIEGALFAQIAVVIAAVVVIVSITLVTDRQDLVRALPSRRAHAVHLCSLCGHDAGRIPVSFDSFGRHSEHHQHRNLRTIHADSTIGRRVGISLWNRLGSAAGNDYSGIDRIRYDAESGNRFDVLPQTSVTVTT